MSNEKHNNCDCSVCTGNSNEEMTNIIKEYIAKGSDLKAWIMGGNFVVFKFSEQAKKQLETSQPVLVLIPRKSETEEINREA